MDHVDSEPEPQTLAALHASLTDEPRTASEIASAVDIEESTAANHLQALADAGEIRTRTVADTSIWWRETAGGGASDMDGTAASDPDGFVDVASLPAIVYRCGTTEGWPMEAVYGSCEALTGYEADALEVGDVDYGGDIIHPDDRGHVREAVEAGRDADSFTVQYRIRTRDGQTRWVWERGRYVDEETLVGLITDIDEQKRTEQALRAEQSFVQSLFDAQQDVVYAFDRDGEMRRWNDRLVEVTGYADDEIDDMHSLDFVTDEDRDRVQDAFVPVLREGESTTIRFTVETKGGDELPYELTASPLREDGDIVGVTGVGRDISDRLEHQAALRRERDFLEELLSVVPSSIAVFDEEGALVRANERANRELGMDTVEDGFEIGDVDLYDEHGDRVPVEERPFARAVRTGEPVADWHCRFDDSDGGTRWASVNAQPVTVDGEVDRVILTARDITHLKAQARKLAARRDELENELEMVFERVTDAFVAFDDEWRFTYVNDRATDLLERNDEELIGASLWDAFPEAVGTRFEEEYRGAMATQEPRTFEAFYPPLGRWFEVNAYPSETGLSVYFNDVTERKARIEQVQRSERRYRTLLENFPNGAVTLYDTDLVCRAAGGENVARAGLSEAEMVGEYVGDVVPEAWREPLIEHYEAALEGSRQRFEVEAGDRIFDVQALPIRGEDGEVFAVMGMSQDVTERREYEAYLQNAKAQLEAATEAGAVGTWEWDVQADELVADRSFARTFGVDPNEAREGVPIDRFLDAVHEDDRDRVMDGVEDALESCGGYEAEYRVWDATGECRWVVARGHVECDDEGTPVSFPGALIDITDRRERERELERRMSQQAALASFSRASLADRPLDDIFDDAVAMVADVLDHDYCKILELDDAGESLHLRNGVGWRDGLVGSASIDADRGSQAGFTLMNEDAVVVEDLETEDRFSGPEILSSHDIQGGISTIIGSPSDPWGILGTHDRNRQSYAESDVQFVESVANLLASVIARHERERRLEESEQRYRTLVENLPNGAVALVDQDLRYTTVGGTPVDDVTAAELRGSRVDDVLTDELRPELLDAYRAALDGERTEFETPVRDTFCRIITTPVRDEDGEVFAAMGMSQDITTRRERERELEHFETLAETASDVLIRIDTDSTIRDVNPAVADVFGYDPDELVGESLSVLMPDHLTDRHREAFATYLASGERSLDWEYIELPAVRADGTEIDVAISFSEYEHGDERFFTGIIRDITQRKTRERALENAYAIIADQEQDLQEKIDGLLEVVRQTVDLPYATLSHVQDQTYTFEYVDAPEDAGISTGTQIPRSDLPNCSTVVETDETLALHDVSTERPDLADPTWGIEAYVGAPIHVAGTVYGTFCCYGTEPRNEQFSTWQVTFVELVSNWIGYALDRRRHTEQLEALNSLHETVRHLTDTAFTQPTREEVESAACERLAASDSYRFAWIAEQDPREQQVVPRTAAGTDGYEEAVNISLEDPAHQQGPTVRAFETGTIQTVQDVHADPAYESWRDLAERYGVQSSAAIPITHEETVYGVLNLYADRPNAFEGRERDVLEQLGAILGHSIASVERKRALMSDELVEVEFAVDDFFGRVANTDHTGEIRIEHTVPVGEDEYLIYGTADEASVDAVEALAESVPAWQRLEFLDEGPPARFEVSLSEPPLLSSIAAIGGSVERAEFADGDLFIRIRLPPDADVRRIIETVQESYPESRMVTHRQVTRDVDTSRQFQTTWSESLTDRQRSALEAAYHAGYFSWPRDASGEDLADSLGVSPPTFYQHLRAAEGKLFGALFEDTDT